MRVEQIGKSNIVIICEGSLKVFVMSRKNAIVAALAGIDMATPINESVYIYDACRMSHEEGLIIIIS